MDQQQSAGVEIKNKKLEQFTAPTPQNTPSNPAPITSTYRPTVESISEDMETINTGAAAQGAAGAFSANPALLSMLQGRLGSLIGRSSGYIESLPTDVKRRLNGLKYLQTKHAEIETQFQEEILELEKKYLELYRPLYQKRTDIVVGKVEPTDEEVEIGKNADGEDEDAAAEEDKKENVDDEKTTGIPEFWLTALKNHPQFSEIITEKDEEVLKHLIDVRMSYIEKPGFKLEFDFEENEFFTNTTLTKTYFYQDQTGYGGDFVYDHAEGTEIKWKEGKDLTVTVETKKQRHKDTNKTRVVKRTVPAETFFTFFSPPAVPADGDVIDEDEAEGLDEKLEQDYDLGEEFKEKIIPHAVDYFTGKALEYGDYEGDDDFEDDFYDDEDEEDDDEDDDDEEDDDDDETAIVNSFTDSKPICLGFNPEGNATVNDLKVRLHSITNVDLTDQRITTIGGKTLDDDSLLFNANDTEGPIIYNLSVRMFGGKGGFGSMLRAQGGRMNAQKSTNFDACRDLQGRRVKAVNDAKKLAEYIEQAPERERQKAEKLKEKIEKALQEPPTKKYRFDDNQFMEDREQVVESVKLAVGDLLKNGGASSSRPKAAKAQVAVMSVFDDDEDDEDDDDEDEEEEEEQVVAESSSSPVAEPISNKSKGKGKAVELSDAIESPNENEEEEEQNTALAAFMEADLDDYDSDEDENFEAASEESEESSDDIDEDDLVDEDDISDDENPTPKAQSSSSATKGKGKATRKRKERED
ncbi:hypothetical protein INT43_005532 [Umbelopsis isabellina]|uniref:SDE2-like domain-containing protein n=1 Tax=Mortierella isabellina TaxID=91625 RepID=A0A8H7PLP5_MORIS|nr:hypothetical protein INT43_005532 [Umbelopsis isabellina]